ncbi:DNA cytosine methyltransferase [Marinobacter shengliensis]|uniref:DNA cytosine methyltransferase n=1 Tax=Marinobacter shengliensis TaxID=1389223 RepID=UPI001109D18B|nr:DNA cytosine methyltransferase [Marinobacter shengliensis]
MSGNGGILHSLRDLPGTYEKSGLGSHAKVWDLSSGTIPSRFDCDVVIAGSPCQGFSTIGKRNLDDPRNSLIHTASIIALSLNPKVIIFENVQGILFGEHKKYLNLICETLNKKNYKTETITIDASTIGIPQTRKRVFVIGWNTSVKNLPKLEKKSTRTLGEVLKNVEGKPNHNVELLDRTSKHYKIARKIGHGQKLCNVRAGNSSIHTWQIPEVFGPVDEEQIMILQTIMKLRRRERLRPTGDADPVCPKRLGEYLKKDVSAAVDNLVNLDYLRRKGSRVDLSNTFNGKYRRPCPKGFSYTVDTRFGNIKNFVHPFENRPFSVREAARIQGFPDSYVFYGSVQDQYKLIGNAVPPPMGEVVAEITMNLLE